jgi:excisionase family DNA binding protein
MSLRQIKISPGNLHDRKIAKRSLTRLEKIVRPKVSGSVFIEINHESVELPRSIVGTLFEVLSVLSETNDEYLVSEESLTTQQAAELLHVSRPYLVKLIDEKSIPCYKVGRYRRVYKSDVIAYKEKSLTERKKILQKLVDEAQELDLGY